MTERRFDPTTGEWRMFARHRQDRTFLPAEDHCPLCPTRPGAPPTEVPFPSFDVVVFENRFPALARHPPGPEVPSSPLYPVAPSFGANEVVVYSDDHSLGLAQMTPGRIAKVVDVWADRYAELSARDEVAYVFVFENRGVALGVTLHHPHGQIYAYPDIPPRPRRELDVATAHLERHGTCVFCDVVTREVSDGVRVIAANRSFVAFVPFAARFPYEAHLVTRRHAPSVLDLTDPERLALAGLLKQVLAAYDDLFGFPLPYVMSVHQAPSDDGHDTVSHFHIELTPIHRTATKLKYLAGSELGAGAFINDTAPEDTAARLRDLVLRAEA
ncbi:MAG TPA: galactose-1-phosphate uridylyltransferase [Acidimicrobiales bacterium]|nr:galactose-1-phosphate uridylyltransferase [Acidimicrobiales bacterium]